VFKELELKKEPYVVELDQRGLFYSHVHIVYISLPYVTTISVYPSVKGVYTVISSTSKEQLDMYFCSQNLVI
jgi:hypothetical protein